VNASSLTFLTSEAERQRRHAALRAAMADAGMDALVIWSRGDEFLRGRVQYVSDIFQWAGWGIVVLPAEGGGTFIGDPLWGIARAEAVEWLLDIRQSADPGSEVASILRDLGAATVGLVGLDEAAPAAHVRQLERAAAEASFVDAGRLFDDVRAIKSDDEIAKLRETSTILLAVFDALAAEIRPGVPERDVTAEGHRLCRQFGCLDGIVQIARPPFAFFSHGSPAPIDRDDVVVIDLEWGGPSGYWLELRRCFSFGSPPDDVRRLWEARLETFEACREAIRPGTSSEGILAARDRAYARHGLTAEGSVVYSAHGIGIDSLEPPWVPGKHRELQEGMVLSLHPDARLDDATLARAGLVSVGDNVLVTPDGGRRLTYDVEEWVTLER